MSTGNKTILITGGSRGIGKATVKRFLSEGWKVITTSTSGKCDYSHDQLQIYKLDLSNKSSIESFTKSLSPVRIKALINNAGIAGDFDEMRVDVNNLRAVLEVNLIGLIDLTEKLVDLNKETLKQIINISSAMGALEENMSDEYVPSYRISKTALNMYSKIIDHNHKGTIQVCSYEPGWVKTDMGGKDAPRDATEPANDLYTLVTKGFKSGKFYGPSGLRDW